VALPVKPEATNLSINDTKTKIIEDFLVEYRKNFKKKESISNAKEFLLLSYNKV